MGHELVRIKKGLDLNLIGEAQGSPAASVMAGKKYAIVPDDYCGLTLRMQKKEGDRVVAGEAVLFDKDHPDIVVAAPVAGIITHVVRGERRKIMSVEIEADGSTERKTFDTTTPDADIKTTLLESGLWAMFSQRPYGIVPDPAIKPRDIFISTFDSAPLSPGNSRYIGLHKEEFAKGVEILSALTDGTVFLGCRQDNEIRVDGSTTIIIDGPHPSGNAGVQIAAVRPVNKGEVVWTIEPEVAARIGHLFLYGYVDYSCVIAVTGEMAQNPAFLTATAGICLSELLRDNIKSGNTPRVISGNVLTGHDVGIDGYLRAPFRQVTVIPEIINDCEMLGWASLSPQKFSAGRTFLSWLLPKSRKYHFDAKINGGERTIIMAGEYDKVLPMDIYAEFLIKAIMARDIDKMEQLGIYEVVPEDFALCEFIDTSKLPLQKIVREGLDFLRKEMN